jgi:hypothetical protein
MPCTDSTRVFVICLDGFDTGCANVGNRKCAWVKKDLERCFYNIFDSVNSGNNDADARRGQDLCPQTCFSRDINCPRPVLGPVDGRISTSNTVKPITISSSNPSQKPTNGRVSSSVSITAEPTMKKTQRPASSVSITADPTTE